jgi:ribonuclease P protein component
MIPPLALTQDVNIPAQSPTAVLLSKAQIGVPVVITTLTQRRDFLRAAQARRMGTGSFLLQARLRGDDSADIRVGFTASKKIGNAVARNRAKRRMRAVMRAVLPQGGQAGWDYVLVAKPQATITRDYCDLLADLSRALAQVHTAKAPSR